MANFKQGQVLTARALNDALAAVLPGRGQVAPGMPGKLASNRTPRPVLKPLHPVYLDKFSMNLPEEEEGWFVLQDGALTRAEAVKEESPVYLVIETDAWGVETSRLITSTETAAVAWDPVQQTPGRVVRKLGRTVKNKYAGAKVGSCLHLFEPEPPRAIEPEVMPLGAKTLPAYWMQFDLTRLEGNTQGVKKILSGGGLLEAPPASGEEACDANVIRLAPRVSLFHLGDDTCAPATSWTEEDCTLRLGEWVPLAKLKIGSENVYLNGYWVTPWRVGLSFAPAEIEVAASGLPEKKVWTGSTPTLGGAWKRVSYTPKVFTLVTPSMWPADCSYEIYDYAVYEAPGTYWPETVAPGSGDTVAPGTGDTATQAQSVLYVAQMRRMRHPQQGAWCQFDATELTAELP